MINQFLNGIPSYTDKLSMHLVTFYSFTFHRLESSCSYMKCQFFALNTMGIKTCQDFRSEMQSCCRSRHTTLDLRIDRLIGSLITLLSLTVEIRRNWQFTHSVDDLCKGDMVTIPLKSNSLTRTMNWTTRGSDTDMLSPDINLTGQQTILPFLQVTHQTIPWTTVCGLEHQLVVRWISRFQQKNFNKCSRAFAIMHSCLNHLRIVEHHQSTRRQILRQMVEHILSYLTFIVDQQFGMITFLDGKLSYALVG